MPGEGLILGLDPLVAAQGVGEEDPERLVDPEKVREPRLGVPIKTPWLAGLPAPIGSDGQIQEYGSLFVGDLPFAEHGEDGTQHRPTLLIRDRIGLEVVRLGFESL